MTSVGPAILDGTMQCIDAVRFEEQDTCTQAYLFHAAAVRKQTDKYESMYAILQGKVIREGLLAHWECESSSENVVVTANICSGILKCFDMTPEINDFLDPVAVYLVSQLNPSGGFQNSQDTVEAMDALTLYGRLLGNVGDTNAEVSVKNGDTVVANVTVNEDNKFVVQSQKLSNNSYGTFKISATGSGNLLVQITNTYNTMIPKEDSPFSFTVTAQAECIGGVATVYNVSICASYIGNRTTTNNVQIDFKSLTGCTVDGYSMYKLLENKTICDYKIVDDHMTINLDPFPQGEERCFTFSSYVTSQVYTMQRSYAIIQDSFDAHTSAFAWYSYPCNQEK
ncbi:pregnancy zone protein-like [Pseudophryne corroboree]|uniref:pregnancy zone protein-like n=1 Tax=Pseudophryne corroboree TaxID=495146 RepID=UPI003081E1F1